MISTAKRFEVPATLEQKPAPQKKDAQKKPEMGTPRPLKTPVKPVAKKKPSQEKNPKLNVAELISFIKTGKTTTAITKLKEYQCASPEGCGYVIFHDNLCFNHYHVKMKYGRTQRVNTKHNGELCAVCKMRPATNRDKCLPCYARQKYHADKAKGIVKSKVKPKAKPVPKAKLSTKNKLLKATAILGKKKITLKPKKGK